MYAWYSWNPEDYESHVWLVYWVVKIYSWYFETNIQVSYLFGIARTRPIHPKIQINSLHFQSFKALNLIWSQKKKASKLLKKHFKSIIFFPDFSRLQGLGGWVRPNLENSRFFFFLNPSLRRLWNENRCVEKNMWIPNDPILCLQYFIIC